ncbi:Dicer-like protein 1 [Polyrhizophydium stewartii]|uniref:Dicer-like protein 1 n=1 Tax=Polyrhizophydium stewartii TaxID=2732419 RepID=A0ABR4NJC7_9FUNG
MSRGGDIPAAGSPVLAAAGFSVAASVPAAAAGAPQPETQPHAAAGDARQALSAAGPSRAHQRARPYQLELFEAALAGNAVAFLDTGSGKTLVSVLLMQELAEPLATAPRAARALAGGDAGGATDSNDTDESDADEEAALPVDRPLVHAADAPPRRIVFLAPTRPLVSQQARKIRADTDLRVAELSSDTATMASYARDAGGRLADLATHHVLVMTPQVCVNLLRHGFIDLSANVRLVVMDECHHATGAHPYSILMREFYHAIAPGQPRPHIFGMTASPVRHRAASHDESRRHMESLQAVLDARIVTVADRAALEGHVPRAVQVLARFSPPMMLLRDVLASRHVGSPCIAALRRIVGPMLAAADAAQDRSRPQAGSAEAAEAADTGRLVQFVRQLESAFSELGAWCTLVMARAHMHAWPHLLADAASGADDSVPTEPTPDDISPKVQALLGIIERHHESRSAASKEDGSDGDAAATAAAAAAAESFRALVFVSQRWFASVLCDLMRCLAKNSHPFLRCGFVTGQKGQQRDAKRAASGGTAHGPTLSGVPRMNVKFQNRMFDLFRAGLYNVLVVTSVAEEGLDIPDCDLVVAFNLFRQQSGFVQARGRARTLTGATFVIMVEDGDDAALRGVASARAIEASTMHIATRRAGDGEPGAGAEAGQAVAEVALDRMRQTELRLVRGIADNVVAELLLGELDPPLSTARGAVLWPSGAVALLHWYASACVNRLPDGPAPVVSYRSAKTPDKSVQAMGVVASWSDYLAAFGAQERAVAALLQSMLTNADTVNGDDKSAREPSADADEDERVGVSQIDVLETSLKREPPFGHVACIDVPASWNIGYERVYGAPRATTKLARQSAALAACRLLFARGELDGFLMPRRLSRTAAKAARKGLSGGVSNNNDDGAGAVLNGKADQADLDAQPEVYAKKLPRALSPHAADDAPRAWHLCVFEFERDGSAAADASAPDPSSDDADDACQTFAVATAHPMPCADIPRMRLFRSRGAHPLLAAAAAWPRPDAPTVWSADEEARLAALQPRLWDLALQRRHLHRDGSRSRPVLGEFFGDANPQAFWVVPMARATVAGAWGIDWPMVAALVSPARVSLLAWMAHVAEPADDHGNAGDSASHRVLATRFFAEAPPSAPASGDLNASRLNERLAADAGAPWLVRATQSLVVTTPHNNFKFRITRWLTDLNAYATFTLDSGRAGSDGAARVRSYLDYFTSKGYAIEHPGACLVQVEPIGVVRDRFKPVGAAHTAGARPPADDGDSTTKASRKRARLDAAASAAAGAAAADAAADEAVIVLPLEVCRVLPVSLGLVRRMHMLPSILHRLESFCSASDFDARFGVAALGQAAPTAAAAAAAGAGVFAPSVPLRTLRTAFVAPGAACDVNYQCLETVGDAVLKFGATWHLFVVHPDASEGRMSELRARLVSNENLCRTALWHGFEGMLTAQPFWARFWAPPGERAWRVLGDAAEGPAASGPPPRLLSRKTLADFVESVLGAYFVGCGQDACMRLLGLMGLVDDDACKRFVVDGGTAVGMPLLTDADAALVRAIESRLGHVFRNPLLAVQAMTHASAATSADGRGWIGSYERLEFLGDAVLDCMLMRHFYGVHGETAMASPSLLSDLRQAACNNQTLARFAVQLGLHDLARFGAQHAGQHADRAALDALVAAAAHGRQLGDAGADLFGESAREAPKWLGDVFEALVGAVFVDTGASLDATWAVVEPVVGAFVAVHATPASIEQSPVRRLHELAQSAGFEPADLSFEFSRDDDGGGGGGAGRVVCAVALVGVVVAEEASNSQHWAKRRAARAALAWMRRNRESLVPMLRERKRRGAADAAAGAGRAPSAAESPWVRVSSPLSEAPLTDRIVRAAPTGEPPVCVYADAVTGFEVFELVDAGDELVPGPQSLDARSGLARRGGLNPGGGGPGWVVCASCPALGATLRACRAVATYARADLARAAGACSAVPVFSFVAAPPDMPPAAGDDATASLAAYVADPNAPCSPPGASVAVGYVHELGDLACARAVSWVRIRRRFAACTRINATAFAVTRAAAAGAAAAVCADAACTVGCAVHAEDGGYAGRRSPRAVGRAGARVDLPEISPSPSLSLRPLVYAGSPASPASPLTPAASPPAASAPGRSPRGRTLSLSSRSPPSLSGQSAASARIAADAALALALARRPVRRSIDGPTVARPVTPPQISVDTPRLSVVSAVSAVSGHSSTVAAAAADATAAAALDPPLPSSRSVTSFVTIASDSASGGPSDTHRHAPPSPVPTPSQTYPLASPHARATPPTALPPLVVTSMAPPPVVTTTATLSSEQQWHVAEHAFSPPAGMDGLVSFARGDVLVVEQLWSPAGTAHAINMSNGLVSLVARDVLEHCVLGGATAVEASSSPSVAPTAGDREIRGVLTPTPQTPPSPSSPPSPEAVVSGEN